MSNGSVDGSEGDFVYGFVDGSVDGFVGGSTVDLLRTKITYGFAP